MRASIVAVVFIAACGGGADKSSCRLPAQASNPMPPGADACFIALRSLNCHDENGGGVSCITNAMTCGATGGPVITCTDECHDDEYAMRCGHSPTSEPMPSSCRTNVLQDPSGNVNGCCPCM